MIESRCSGLVHIQLLQLTRHGSYKTSIRLQLDTGGHRCLYKTYHRHHIICRHKKSFAIQDAFLDSITEAVYRVRVKIQVIQNILGHFIKEIVIIMF